MWAYPVVLLVLMMLLLGSCQQDEQREDKASQPATSLDVCTLLSQEELAPLFACSGKTPGEAQANQPAPQVQGCGWKAEGGAVPALIVQVLPPSGNIRTSIDLGNKYRISTITRLQYPAAASFTMDKGELALLGMDTGEHLITFSPVLLDGIQEDSEAYTILKQLAENVGNKL